MLKILFFVIFIGAIAFGFAAEALNFPSVGQSFSFKSLLDGLGLPKIESQQKGVLSQRQLERKRSEERFASLAEKERSLMESTRDKITQLKQKREVSSDPRQLKQESEDLANTIEQKKDQILERRKLQEEQKRRLKELTDSRKAILEDRLRDQRLK